MKRMNMVLSAALVASLLIGGIAVAKAQDEAHLMRFADIHEDLIVFTYEDDLWLVADDGGPARRITRHPGVESEAKFSPDGSRIAFTGQYDGGTDVYVIPTAGGVPERLTWHPFRDRVVDWAPDGKSILFRSYRELAAGAEMIYSVPADGGMPERVAIDRGGLACFSPDGKKLAYNRISREARTWKRYQGGMAQDVWVADFESGAITKITDWVGSDNFPMWHGDFIYFNSDREDGTLNLYRCAPDGSGVTRLTDYDDYDIKYPSIGDGRIVFQYAESLHVLDIASGDVRKVPVTIASDRIHTRPELVSVSPRTGSFNLSPSATRALVEARGEILNLPVEDGRAINLTRSSASREKNAAWSPDGRWVAFVSDRDGEEQLYLVDQKGEDEWKRLGNGSKGFLMQPVWSPDSKYLLYSDKFMRLQMIDVESGRRTLIDKSDYDDAWERWGIQDYVWSPCSRWIAYSKQGYNMHESINLYSLDSGETTAVTDDFHNDWSPSFDPDGDYLYFLSNRTYNPIMGAIDQNHIFLETARPYVVLLRDGEVSPFLPEDSEEAVESGEEDEADDEADDDEEAEEDEDAATQIDLDGIADRILAAEGAGAGNYFRLEAISGGFLVLKKDEPEFLKYQNVNDGTTDALALYKYDLAEEDFSEIMSGIANYHLNAAGDKMIYRGGSTYGVVDAAAGGSVGDGSLDLGSVRIEVTRAEEFLNIFDEAWRIQRDWFYDEGMHGLDWKAIGEKYRRFVPWCGVRGDLNYLIGEMIGELNIGHTYIQGGDFEDGGGRVGVGVLGCDFAVEKGKKYYRIDHILPGKSWDPGLASPLAAPGCPIGEGDYLIAIDGNEVKVGDNVFRHLLDKAGDVVTLTWNDKASADDAEDYRCQTLRFDHNLRYQEWVDVNRAMVDELSDGRLGYVHITDMGRQGLIDFGKQFYSQTLREGMVIDIRYNGGGFVGDMIIDRLERKLWALTAPREGKIARDPERALHGPIIVLINEDAGSNAEYFARAIQVKQLAPVIGMRTWGGAVGIEPHQDMVDGSGTTPPQFGLFGLDRQWLIEGHGVDPDVEVQNMPADVVAGRDTQLTTAIEMLLDDLRQNGGRWEIPATPAYPDKSR